MAATEPKQFIKLLPHRYASTAGEVKSHQPQNDHIAVMTEVHTEVQYALRPPMHDSNSSTSEEAESQRRLVVKS